MFDVFDEVVRKAKKELNSVKPPALQTVISLFSDINEANYTGAAKRQRLVEEMRNRLHSDVCGIDADDISSRVRRPAPHSHVERVGFCRTSR